MKPKPQTLRRIRLGIALVALLATGGALMWMSRSRQQSLAISCANHGHFIHMTMIFDHYERETLEIPYLPEIDGYRMLTAYVIAGNGPIHGTFNCHHGAYGFRRGGWQCVNLPPAKWRELFTRAAASDWANKHRTALDGIPIFWCGQPGGTGTRVCGSVAVREGNPSFWYHTRVPESELTSRLEWLNRQLVELGEKPVSLNLPPNINWPEVVKWSEQATNLFPHIVWLQN